MQFDCVKRSKKIQKPPPYNKGQPTKKQRLLIPKNNNNSNDTVLLIYNDTLPTTKSPIVRKKTTRKVKKSSNCDKSKSRKLIFEEINCDEIVLIPENLNESEPSTENPLTASETNDKIPNLVIKEDFSSGLSVKQENSNDSPNDSEEETSNATFVNLDVEDHIPENIINKSDKISNTTKSTSFNSTLNIPANLLSLKFNSSIFSKQNAENMLPSMPFLLTPQKEALQKDLELSGESSDDKSPSFERPSVNDEKQTPNEMNQNEKLSTNDDEIIETENELQKKDDYHESTQKKDDESESLKKYDEDELQNKKDDEDELNALMVASTTLQQKNKRIQTNLTKKAKQMKQYNATLAMLCPEDSNHIEEKAKSIFFSVIITIPINSRDICRLCAGVLR